MARLIVLTSWCILGSLLAGCSGESAKTEAAGQLIRTVTLEPRDNTSSVTLTGTIAARVESNLSFRTSGKIVERIVDVGDRVAKGQVLARLDSKLQTADVEGARAAVAAAEAQVKQATAAFNRLEKLLRDGYTTRREYEAAEAALKMALAGAQSAKARLASAEEALSFVELNSDADGIVTARLADAGESVQLATTIFTVAQDGPRDAVFDLYEALLLRGDEPPTVFVSLVADPSIKTKGRVRQTTPNVDPTTGTVRVKVELETVPDGMTLGSAVTGTGTLPTRPAFVLPAAAMTAASGQPAVWIVDGAAQTVSVRPVHVASYEANSAVIDDGLVSGDQVAVDGTKLLRPGQRISIVEEGHGQ